MKFELHELFPNKWRWYLVGGNGRIISHSIKVFSRKSTCVRGVKNLAWNLGFLYKLSSLTQNKVGTYELCVM